MKKKWKLIAGAAAVLAVLGVLVFQSFQPLKLELLKIEKRSIAKTFIEEGLAVSDSEHPISTVTGGKVVRIPVEEGQQVKKGTLLIEFDSTELVFQAEQLRAQLKSAAGEEAKTLKDTYDAELAKQKALLEQAERSREAARNNFDRVNTLYEAGAASQVEYEYARDSLAEAESRVAVETAALEALKKQYDPAGGASQYFAGLKESLQAQLDHLEYQIDQCTIEAPSDGVVARLSVKEGETVLPNTQVMTLLSEGALKIETFVLTEDVEDIRVGMEVALIQDKVDGDVSFPGTVSAIAPSAVEKISALGLEEQRVKVTVMPDIPKDITIRPGYALDVEFKTAEEMGQLVVPKTAVFPYNDGDALWVVRRGKLQIQPIKKGFENDTEIAVTEGLKEGEMVVLDPQAEGLKEGKRAAD